MALISVSNNALSNISVLPASIPTGALTLIKSVTASASASISFVHGTDGVVLDGTYSSYVFSFINIHPQTDATAFQMNFSTDNGSNYNVIKTSTYIVAWHNDADTSTNLAYDTAWDLAQSSANHYLQTNLGNDNDQNCGGYLHLSNPSSSTYVKHWKSNISTYHNADYELQTLTAGYGNTTSAVNAIRFQMSSGNIDDGTIKLYGVK